jgi:hypothetical protein
VWPKALQRIDRALVELAIKVAGSIRNPNLAKSIHVIAGKLEAFKESRFLCVIREFCMTVVEELSRSFTP